MKCDKCQNETLVYDSRPKDNTIRRRRKCAKCEHRFTTVEMYLTQVNQVVPKPEPAPPPVKKRRVKPRVKRFEDLDFDNMTDEEIERAMEQYS